MSRIVRIKNCIPRGIWSLSRANFARNSAESVINRDASLMSGRGDRHVVVGANGNVKWRGITCMNLANKRSIKILIKSLSRDEARSAERPLRGVRGEEEISLLWRLKGNRCRSDIKEEKGESCATLNIIKPHNDIQRYSTNLDMVPIRFTRWRTFQLVTGIQKSARRVSSVTGRGLEKNKGILCPNRNGNSPVIL